MTRATEGGDVAANAKAYVLDMIDGIQDEIVKIVSEVVEIPTVEPNHPGVDNSAVLGGETEVNLYLAEVCREIGCQVDLSEEEPKRANLVGVL